MYECIKIGMSNLLLELGRWSRRILSFYSIIWVIIRLRVAGSSLRFSVIRVFLWVSLAPRSWFYMRCLRVGLEWHVGRLSILVNWWLFRAVFTCFTLTNIECEVVDLADRSLDIFNSNWLPSCISSSDLIVIGLFHSRAVTSRDLSFPLICVVDILIIGV